MRKIKEKSWLPKPTLVLKVGEPLPEHLSILQNKIAKADIDISKKKKARKKLHHELQALCDHKKTHFEEKYESGGYDYTSSTTKWEVCDICGMESAKQITDHGHYG